MRVKLAIALDGADLERAIEVAHKISAYADWFYMGSSLVESRGMRAVWALSSAFPGHEIAVDLRSCAASEGKASVAFTAGADLVVLPEGAAARACGEAVGSARIFGSKTVLDVREASDALVAAQRGIELGFDYLLIRPDELFRWSESTGHFPEEKPWLPLIVDAEGDLDAAFFEGELVAGVLVGASVSGASDPAFAAGRLKSLIRGASRLRIAA